MFGIHSLLPNVKFYFRTGLHHHNKLLIESEVFGLIDHFPYIGSLIRTDGLVSDESRHEFRRLEWLLSTYVTCGVGETFVFQLEEQLTTQ